MSRASSSKTWTLDTGPKNFNMDKDPNLIYGVGDIMRWSMDALLAAYVDGINPVRTPIAHQIYYPNTVYGCSTPYWSCYKAEHVGSPIYIGFQNTHVSRAAVQHELGHSVADIYRPVGVGGEHNGNLCDADERLAFSEAFATFFATWTHNPDRHAVPDPIAAESPTADCSLGINQNGTMSEAWVLGALWDLHDQHVDGEDTLGMLSPSFIMRLYLLEPTFDDQPVDTIERFRTQLLSTMSPNGQAWANKVFKQNLIP